MQELKRGWHCRCTSTTLKRQQHCADIDSPFDTSSALPLSQVVTPTPWQSGARSSTQSQAPPAAAPSSPCRYSGGLLRSCLPFVQDRHGRGWALAPGGDGGDECSCFLGWSDQKESWFTPNGASVVVSALTSACIQERTAAMACSSRSGTASTSALTCTAGAVPSLCSLTGRRCNCGPSCFLRVASRGIRVPVQAVFVNRRVGWGLRAVRAGVLRRLTRAISPVPSRRGSLLLFTRASGSHTVTLREGWFKASAALLCSICLVTTTALVSSFFAPVLPRHAASRCLRCGEHGTAVQPQASVARRAARAEGKEQLQPKHAAGCCGPRWALQEVSARGLLRTTGYSGDLAATLQGSQPLTPSRSPVRS